MVESSLEESVGVPLEELTCGTKCRVGRRPQCTAIELVVDLPVVPIVFEAPAHPELAVRCDGHIASIEQLVDVRP
jgi:hypothetical protein